MQFIVDKLFWPVTYLLESVGAHEPQVDKIRDKICYLTQQAIIPLKAYAVKFEPHLELLNRDIKEFIRWV